MDLIVCLCKRLKVLLAVLSLRHERVHVCTECVYVCVCVMGGPPIRDKQNEG